MKKVVESRGITLIALVITIIVLLILAGITINLTLGQNGIITRAKEAGRNYTEAANYENSQLQEFTDLTDQIIANVTGVNPSTDGTGDNPSTDGTTTPSDIKITGISLNKTSTTINIQNTENLIATITPTDASNKNLVWTSDNENIATVENGLITAKALGTATITATAGDGSGITVSCTVTVTADVSDLKAGDYIKYDSGTNGVITCRVLYETDSQYGLQIISDKNVKKVELGSSTYSEAVTSYNNAIETLNNEAEAYINSEYAYDARCVGSLPTINTNGTFKEKDSGATTYVTPQYTNASYINSLDTDKNYEIDQTQMQTVGIWTTGENYWLASRYVDYDSFAHYFSVQMVDTNLGLSAYTLCRVLSSGTFGYSGKNGFRPCISLKSDIIKITGGDGKSADNAYIIGK